MGDLQQVRGFGPFVEDLRTLKQLVGISYERIEQFSERRLRGGRADPAGSAGRCVLTRTTTHRMLKYGDITAADRPRVMTLIAVCLQAAEEGGVALPETWRGMDTWVDRWSSLVSRSVSTPGRGPASRDGYGEAEDDGSGEGDAPGMERLGPAGELWPDTHPGLGELAAAVRGLGRAGRPVAASAQADELVLRCVHALGADHVGTLAARQAAAYWTGEAGRMREAVKLTLAVLGDSRRLLGADSPYTRMTERRLIYWVGTAGDWHRAWHHANRLLARWEDDPAVDAVDLGLARVDALYAMAQVRGWNSAVPYLRHEIPSLTGLLGPYHPTILWMRASVVEGLVYSGESAKAAERAARVVEDTEARFGSDHHRVLWARSAQTAALRESGRAAETMDVARVNSAMADRVLGVLHAEAVKVKLTYLEALHEGGAAGEAREVGRELLVAAHSGMGWDSLSMLRIRLALLRTGNTVLGGGLPVLDTGPATLLADSRRLLGADHEVTLRTRLLVASAGGRNRRGVAELADDCRRVLGVTHPLTVEAQVASEAPVRGSG